MKILILGDTHGNTLWKTLIKKEKPDKVIMLGDYLDSFNISNSDQILNFTEILKTQKEWGKENFILCLGNHDYHYFNNVTYFGYQAGIYIQVSEILKQAWENKDIIPLYIENNIIFSHAGVSKYWLDNISNVHNVKEINSDTLNLKTLDWNDIEGFNSYGGTISNSPIWIRPWALQTNMLPEYTQIVGHTGTTKIVNEEKLWTVDTLPREYLILDNNQFIIKQV